MFAPKGYKATNKVATVPAPNGGLNTRDSIAAMPPTDALVMVNWWPQPYGLGIRKGYSQWATGLPGAVNTLASWNAENGTDSLFAWSGSSMYDVTTKGPVGLPLLTGLINADWQTAQMSNAAGNHLVAVNGQDNGIIYNSTGVHIVTLGDGTAAYTWAGLDPKDAVQLTSHQGRLWAVEKNTSIGWYLPVDSIQGVWQPFDFGALFILGGALAFLTTWTLDDGDGAEDHLIAVSTRGEAAVYRGTDPDSDTSWQLNGVYRIGAPVAGRRAYSKVGGDVYILTAQGLVSMTGQLVSTTVEERASKLKTNKIQLLVSELVNTYIDGKYWQVAYSAAHNIVLVNVPATTQAGAIQLACNVVTPDTPWTQFEGINANCWGSLGVNIMFGGRNGVVYKAWDGTLDNVQLNASGGEPIVAKVQQAYSYFGGSANQMQVGMFRPNFITGSPIDGQGRILYDWSTQGLDAINPNANLGVPGIWNAGIWNLDLWSGSGNSGGNSLYGRKWIQAEGIGVCVAVRLEVNASTEMLWVSTDYSYKDGTIL